jgi:hypothetical protein
MQDFSNRVFLLSVSPIVAAGLRSGVVLESLDLRFKFLGFLL